MLIINRVLLTGAGAFWTNFVVGDGDGAVGVLPYGVKCLPAGVQVSYGAARRVLQPVWMDIVYTRVDQY